MVTATQYFSFYKYFLKYKIKKEASLIANFRKALFVQNQVVFSVLPEATNETAVIFFFFWIKSL